VWNSYELDLINYQNKCRLIRGWDDLFNRVKEHINSVSAMKLSPYYKVSVSLVMSHRSLSHRFSQNVFMLLVCPPEEGQAWMGKMQRRISFGINKVIKKPVGEELFGPEPTKYTVKYIPNNCVSSPGTHTPYIISITSW